MNTQTAPSGAQINQDDKTFGEVGDGQETVLIEIVATDRNEFTRITQSELARLETIIEERALDLMVIAKTDLSTASSAEEILSWFEN